MKRALFVACIAALMLAAVSSVPATAQPQYYNYSNATANANSFPFNQPGGRTVQLLYLPGDFNQPSAAPSGTISSVSFQINSGYPLGPWTYSEFTIKMGQSSITTFTSGGFYPGSLTTVYYRSSVTLSAAAGTWLTFTLDTPFAYDSTQSLIVDVGQCGAPGATGYSATYTGLTGYRRIFSGGGCPFAYYSADADVYHAGVSFSSTAQPPTVTTSAATSVGQTGATLNGTVDANGLSTTVTFEYGETTAYGTTVTAAQSPVTGTSATPVSAAITGLDTDTLYHFRVVGVSTGGTSNGDDMTFRTAMADPIPTLSEWGMLLLVVLVGAASVLCLRRRRPAAQATAV
jgi:hypothetical protein